MYKVPFVGLKNAFIDHGDEVIEIVERLLSQGELIMRDELEIFEKDAADYVNCGYGIGLNSGTDALHLGLRACGVGEGDEVITVAHTFVASISSIVHCGASPVLVDICDDFNMDVSQVEKSITSRTKAIMPVHLNGRICDMDEIKRISQKFDLHIIEDACQAWGANYAGTKAGAFGSVGCFSTYPMKTLGGFGDGGLAVTNDSNIDKNMRLYRDHGQVRRDGKIDIAFHGFNSRLDNIQAAVLSLRIKLLDSWVSRRREIASQYNEGISNNPIIKTPPPPTMDGPYFDSYQNYVIRVEEGKRDLLVDHLKRNDVEVLISWPIPAHFYESLGLSHFSLPMTEKASTEVISLPMYPELTDEQVNYVVDVVNEFKE